MFKQRKTESHDRGQTIWFLLPESERTAVRVLNELSREGFKVSKATVSRWANNWKQAAHKAVDLIPLPDKGVEAPADDLSDIPEWIRKALPERLLVIARGKGLDRVEHAICLLCDGLSARVEQIVRDDRSLLVTAGALSAMATAMYQVTSARAIVAIAHRSFCEGDKLSAEAKKVEAEAQVASRNGRA
jgi:hypothetical protein